MEAGAVAALVVAGLAKAAGSSIAGSADLGFLGDLLKSGAEVAGKVGGDPVAELVNRLVREKRRDRMLRSASWYDLAGLAWGEHLYEHDDDLVRVFGVAAAQVQRRLDAEWFASLLQGPRGREVPVPKVEAAYGEELDPAFVGALARFLAGECVDELEVDADEDVLPFVTTAILALPARIARIAKQVPGYDARMARLLLADRVVPGIERLLAYADGTVAAEEALREMDRLSVETLALADRDTFGRDHFEDLPKLVHREVYVEPDVAGRPAKQAIRDAWERARFVILRAPFGMGKSLTCRDLAIDLAREWREDPSRPFPLRLDCPDLLSGNVNSLRDAVLKHLENVGFGPAEAAWTWGKARLTVLLDGFDEISQAPGQLKRWIEDMASATRREGLVVALFTRPYGYEPQWVRGDAVELDLEALTENQAQDWLIRHATALGRATPALAAIEDRLDEEIARTPILLLMAVYAWDQPSDDGLDGKAALYARFVDRISTGKWADLQDPHPAVASAHAEYGEALYREALEQVAWAHHVHVRGDEGGLPLRLLERRLADWHELSPDQVTELGRALVLSLFFRKDDVRGDLRFSHRSFREFLCARYLAGRSGNELLLALAEDDPGPETLRFLEELLRPHPDRLASALRTVEAAFDGGLEVAFVDSDLVLESWAGRNVALIHTRRPLFVNCDQTSAALRRQPWVAHRHSIVNGWLADPTGPTAWHRATGTQGFRWPTNVEFPEQCFCPHGVDGREDLGGLMVYWLERMGDLRVTHADLARLWGEIGVHLSVLEGTGMPTVHLAVRATPDGRWLLGGQPFGGSWAGSWARTVRRVFGAHAVHQRDDARLRALHRALVLTGDGRQDLAAPWPELLDGWAWFAEQVAASSTQADRQAGSTSTPRRVMPP